MCVRYISLTIKIIKHNTHVNVKPEIFFATNSRNFVDWIESRKYSSTGRGVYEKWHATVCPSFRDLCFEVNDIHTTKLVAFYLEEEERWQKSIILSVTLTPLINIGIAVEEQSIVIALNERLIVL